MKSQEMNFGRQSDDSSLFPCVIRAIGVIRGQNPDFLPWVAGENLAEFECYFVRAEVFLFAIIRVIRGPFLISCVS